MELSLLTSQTTAVFTYINNLGMPIGAHGAPGQRKVTLNLKTAVEREKAVQAIDVQREWTHCVVTFWVMSQCVHFLDASRGCADFRDPTAICRLK